MSDASLFRPELSETRILLTIKELPQMPKASSVLEALSRCTLERVVLCVKTGMQPFAVCEFSVRNAEVVSKHPERVKQVGPARQQGAPPSSHDQPCNVDHAVQHEQVSKQPMQAQSQR